METSAQPQAEAAAAATAASDSTTTDDRLTDIGARTLQMYQAQVTLANGAWLMFALCSVGTVLIAIVFRLFREANVVDVPPSVWIVPVALYVALLGGNFSVLGLRLDELRLVRGVTLAEAGLEFKPVEPATAKRSYGMVEFFVVVAYFVLWLTQY